MTKGQIENAKNWCLKVLEYSEDDNIPLLGTKEAKKKAQRYNRLLRKHEKVSGDVKFGHDYLSDFLNSIIYAKL